MIAVAARLRISQRVARNEKGDRVAERNSEQKRERNYYETGGASLQ